MKTTCNLLPESIQRRQIARFLMLRWAMVWMATAIVTGLACWGQWLASGELRFVRADLEDRYLPIAKAKAEIKHLREEIAQMQYEVDSGLALAEKRPALAVLGALSRTTRKTHGTVAVQKVALMPKGRAPGDPSDELAKTRVVIQGLGKHPVSVAAFASALEELKMFRHVELDSTSEGERSGVPVTNYVIECVY